MISLDQNALKIGEMVATVFRNKTKVLLYNVIVLTAVVMLVLFWPRSYRSEAKIWMKIGRENSRLDPTTTTGDTVSIQETDREDEIKSVMDILSGRGVAEGVVDDLGAGLSSATNRSGRVLKRVTV